MSFFQNSRDCYCAFCRSPRKIYTRKHVGVAQVFMSLIVAAMVMWVFWGEFEPKALVFAVGFISIAECFAQIRWRLFLVCRKCGFDPVLYLRDKAACVQKVKSRLEQRKLQTELILAEPLNLPFLSKEKAEALSHPTDQGTGRIVSKQV